MTGEIIAKKTAILASRLLHQWGCREVVVSPGSRCAPLTVAFARDDHYRLHPVVDERCAAFVALGMASALGQPVALICTSGTAMLNYAPALAEAYYRRISLIALTADRPERWIDQRDSQTIRQAHALDAVVRHSVDIRDDSSPEYLHHATLLLNDALDAACGRICGPVHVNMQFDAPLTTMMPAADAAHIQPRRLRYPLQQPAPDYSPVIGTIPPTARVMVVAGDGDGECGPALEAAGGKLLVMAEAQSNIKCTAMREVDYADTTFQAPDVVIVTGGAIVNQRLKNYLRSLDHTRFISVGYDDRITDTYNNLDTHIDGNVSDFLTALTAHLSDTGYGRDYPARAPYALPGLQQAVDALKGYDIHFSNGTSVRHAQGLKLDGRVYSNRGVSGIDGCTSTAIGAAMAGVRPVALVTGDMSAAYDVGALAIDGIPPTFRMIVLDNGGGDIFRAIATTRRLPECEDYFAMAPRFPIEGLARAYGMGYYASDGGAPDSSIIAAWAAHKGAPAILRLRVDTAETKKMFANL